MNFFLKKIFRRNLNEANSKVEIDVTFKMTPISANELASFK